MAQHVAPDIPATPNIYFRKSHAQNHVSRNLVVEMLTSKMDRDSESPPKEPKEAAVSKSDGSSTGLFFLRTQNEKGQRGKRSDFWMMARCLFLCGMSEGLRGRSSVSEFEERMTVEKGRHGGSLRKPADSAAFGEAVSDLSASGAWFHAFFGRCCGCIIAISLLYGHA